ncbi:DUF4238 domain-containing protein, partial [Vibrio alginolyticus]|nr:DUF4238 domain-containing protein [Vibrio alginolyticus]
MATSPNKQFKSDSARLAFLVWVKFSVYGGQIKYRGCVLHTLIGRYVSTGEFRLSNQIKKNHHFVPQFYLKGFAQESDDQVSVLRKPWGNISKKHPAQIMYNPHLYTIGFKNERSQMIEDFYAELESELSDAILLMEELRANPKLYVEIKNNVEFNQLIKVIVALQFWRVPNREELTRKLSGKLLDLYDGSSDLTKSVLGNERAFIKFLYKRRHKESALKLIQNSLLPLLTFRMLDEDLIDFNFYVTKEAESVVLTSDNPVLYDSLADLFSFKKFAFPLTKDIIIASKFEKIMVGQFNRLITQTAIERVVGYSSEVLETYAKPYLTHNKQFKSDS